MQLPLWVRGAIEDGLGRVVAASLQEGHEGSEPRLAVLLKVEIPLNKQLSEPFPEGTLGADMVTVADVTVKFSPNMEWVRAIVIRNENPKFYYTQSFINKKAGDLREIAILAREEFFKHISSKREAG